MTAIAHRDATYSAVTQERLRSLLERLTSEPGWNAGKQAEHVYALTDVIERWDANDATECFIDDETGEWVDFAEVSA